MRSKKLFLASTVLIVLVSLPLISLVEASSITWSRTYGGPKWDYVHSLVETSDGGFILAGISRDEYGFDIDCLLVKTDAYGNMEWNQTYGGEYSYHGDAVVQTSDGGYAIAGDKYSIGEGYDSWLAKTDAHGKMEWNRTYGGASIDHTNSLVETPDGGFAIAGYTTFVARNHDFWLIKTDAYGNVEWNQTYGGTGNEYATSLVETFDGGYALAGGTETSFWSGRRDFLLVKTDGYGNMEWNQTYGGDGYDYARSLVATSDGGYAIVGGKDGGVYGGGNFFLVKTDGYGNMEWNRTYSTTSANSLVATSDGGFAIAGYNQLIKTDEHGNMEWNRTYNGGSARSLIETSDGGFSLAGHSGSSDIAGKTDFWLAKTDEHGCIPEWYPPYICVDSPQNVTYTIDSVSLNFTVNEETSWMGYSLDGQDNVTITETTLNLTELAEGSHNITFYATDTDGNTVASETISFTITKDETPVAQDDEIPTSWTTTAIAIAAVATAAAAITLYYTKTKKQNKK